MLFSEILRDLPTLQTRGNLDLDVGRVTYDSREVKPGDLFVALRGSQTDGHRYIRQAFERGAVAALVEEPVDAPCWAVVGDTLPALALAASKVYGSPADSLTLIGVTGTNGKTTTTYLIEAIGRAAGRSMGLLGTIEYRWPGFSKPAPHTTPFSSDLQEGLATMREAGVTAVAMEVSSHALGLHRVDTLHFDVGAFTNLTPEHLDFHGTMESYAETKLRLFTEHLKPEGRAALNIDDHWARAWVHELPHHSILSYGFRTEAQIRPENFSFEPDGIEAVLWTPAGRLAIESNLVGRHNLYNLMAAIAASLAIGISPDDIEEGIRKGIHVPGRLEAVDKGQPFRVFVDYAHTPDGVYQVLGTLREIQHRRLISVVGCGGDRDRKKRPRMASIAQENSDLLILTSDNPRTEDPEKILNEMEAGMIGAAGSSYLRLADRREAIAKAIELAGAGDIVVIAGKGHEDYQEIGRTRHPFDDRLVAAEALARAGFTGGKA
jgi:UDP-N-acetylmuramoyl-L-alanyl-D-glutamate--2,6-diaminopimelate ligase